jgi:hypothetical protein
MRKLIGVVGGLGPLASTRLLDLAIEAGLTARGKILLLCTNGARKLRLFEGARNWEQLADRVSFPQRTAELIRDDALYQASYSG